MRRRELVLNQKSLSLRCAIHVYVAVTDTKERGSDLGKDSCCGENLPLLLPLLWLLDRMSSLQSDSMINLPDSSAPSLCMIPPFKLSVCNDHCGHKNGKKTDQSAPILITTPLSSTKRQNLNSELSYLDRSESGETPTTGFFSYTEERRRTGIWLRGVCASVTVVEIRGGFERRAFGRNCRFCGEAGG
jgi:hypothetical protein